MNESLVERIKQVFGDFDVITFLEQHNVKYDEWLKSQIFQLLEVVEKEVLKILEGEKQKLEEKLFRLMCLRAGSIYFSDEENGMKILLLELLTAKKFKSRRGIDAFLNVARMCKSMKEARAKFDVLRVESAKKETTK